MNPESSLQSVGGLAPDVLPWILLAITLTAGFCFIRGIWPKWKVLVLANPDNRFNEIPARISAVLQIALGQSKMFKDKGPGWMHALIFWGFLILLLRAAEFFSWGFFPSLYVPGSPTGGFSLMTAYYHLKDVVVILISLACVYGLYRRLVVKPERLTLSGEGLLILVMILVIMVSDLVFDRHTGYGIKNSRLVGAYPDNPGLHQPAPAFKTFPYRHLHSQCVFFQGRGGRQRTSPHRL